MSKDLLVENILTLLPEFHKKFFRGLPPSDISFPQIKLLLYISKHSNMNMSFFSDMTMISKPNLTLMVDKLIEEGLIERGFDKEDRRIITLDITQKGRGILEVQRNKLKELIMQRLSDIDTEKIDKLNKLFGELEDIFLR